MKVCGRQIVIKLQLEWKFFGEKIQHQLLLVSIYWMDTLKKDSLFVFFEVMHYILKDLNWAYGYKTISHKEAIWRCRTEKKKLWYQVSLHLDKTPKAQKWFHFTCNNILLWFDYSPNCGWSQCKDHPPLLISHKSNTQVMLKERKKTALCFHLHTDMRLMFDDSFKFIMVLDYV